MRSKKKFTFFSKIYSSEIELVGYFGDEITGFRNRRDATRCDTTRSTRLVTIRVNCPAVAAPTRHSDVVMHSQAFASCTFARRRWRGRLYSVVALAARSNVVLQLFAAVSRSAGVSRWRSGYALQTSDAFSSLIMHLHLVPSPARNVARNYASTHSRFFLACCYPATRQRNVIRLNNDFWNVRPISFAHL